VYLLAILDKFFNLFLTMCAENSPFLNVLFYQKNIYLANCNVNWRFWMLQ